MRGGYRLEPPTVSAFVRSSLEGSLRVAIESTCSQPLVIWARQELNLVPPVMSRLIGARERSLSFPHHRVGLSAVHLLTSRRSVRFKVTCGLEERLERDPSLAVQQLKMGFSKHGRHWSQLGEKALELLMPVPQRHVLEVLDTESPRTRALSHSAGQSFCEPFRVFAGRADEPVIEIALWPKVLRWYQDPAADAEAFCKGNRSIRCVAVERHVHAPTTTEERLVLARPALGAVDAAGGNAGQQHAQRSWDALAEYDCGVRIDYVKNRLVGLIDVTGSRGMGNNR
jgi:hypothetical protein